MAGAPKQLRVPVAPIAFVDPKTGVLTIDAVRYFAELQGLMVQGPSVAVTNGDPALWDGDSGRLLKD